MDAFSVAALLSNATVTQNVIFKMKKCKSCKSRLKKIGVVEPDTAIISTKSPSIDIYDGVEYFILFILIGILFMFSLIEEHFVLAYIVFCLFAGMGVYLWKRPRIVYRCIKCGEEYYGNNLSIYKR